MKVRTGLLALILLIGCAILYYLKSGNQLSESAGSSQEKGPTLQAVLSGREEDPKAANEVKRKPSTYEEVSKGAPWKLSRSDLTQFLEIHDRSPQSLIAALYATDDPDLREELASQHGDVFEVALYLGISESDPESKLDWYRKLATIDPENSAGPLLEAGVCSETGKMEEAKEAILSALEKPNAYLFGADSQDLAKEALMSVHPPILASALSTRFGVDAIDTIREPRDTIRENIRELAAAGNQEALFAEVSSVALPWIDKAQELPEIERSLMATLSFSGLEDEVFKSFPRDYIYGPTGLTVAEMIEERSEAVEELVDISRERMLRLPGASPAISEAYWNRVRNHGEIEATRWLASLSL